jgi:hypothetical protein
MKRLIIPVILFFLLSISVVLNIRYFLDEDCAEYTTARFVEQAPRSIELKDFQKKLKEKDGSQKVLTSSKKTNDSISYEQLVEESQEHLRVFLSEETGLNPKEVGLALEILHQSELEVKDFVDERAEAHAKKYGTNMSYIYQAEDYVFLGQARIRARERLIELMGKKKWEELYDHIQEYNQGKFSSHPINPIDI